LTPNSLATARWPPHSPNSVTRPVTNKLLHLILKCASTAVSSGSSFKLCLLMQGGQRNCLGKL
jgi:hypothetical protein